MIIMIPSTALLPGLQLLTGMFEYPSRAKQHAGPALCLCLLRSMISECFAASDLLYPPWTSHRCYRTLPWPYVPQFTLLQQVKNGNRIVAKAVRTCMLVLVKLTPPYLRGAAAPVYMDRKFWACEWIEFCHLQSKVCTSLPRLRVSSVSCTASCIFSVVRPAQVQ